MFPVSRYMPLSIKITYSPTPGQMDAVFTVCREKGIRSFSELFIDGKCVSFSAFSSKYNLPNTHVFATSQSNTVLMFGAHNLNPPLICTFSMKSFCCPWIPGGLYHNLLLRLLLILLAWPGQQIWTISCLWSSEKRLYARCIIAQSNPASGLSSTGFYTDCITLK